MKHTRARAALALAATLSVVGLTSAQAQIPEPAGHAPAGVVVHGHGTASRDVTGSAGVGQTVTAPARVRPAVTAPGGVRPAVTVPAGAGTVDLAGRAEGAPARPLASPLVPLRVARLFDPPPQPWNAGHRGIDLRSTAGAVVRSPGPGTVAFVGVVVNRPVLSIDLDMGLRASFEPVSSDLDVGDRVARGEALGTVAAALDDGGTGVLSASHCQPRVCLHWGLRSGGDYVNPLDWLEGFGPIRLLRLGEP